MTDPTPKPATSGPRKTFWSRNRRTLLWGLAAVVALAAVVFAASALSSPKRSPQLPEVTVTSPQQSRKDYSDALSALASGDTTRAEQLLEKSVTEDASNKDAAKKLDEVRSSTPLPKGTQQTPTKTDTSNPAPVTPGDSPFAKEVADIGTLMPDSVPGFVPGQKVVVRTDAELALDPDGSLASRVTRVQLSVHYRGSSEAAAAYVQQHAATLYPKNASSLTINGAQGRTGTDNGRLAAVIFARGWYAFEVVVTSAGSDPSSVLDVARKAAEAFPTNP